MKSEIVVILDRSGSMDQIRTDAIGGFNSFIEEQKKIEGEATVTLVQFDDQYETVFENIPLNEVNPLNMDTFVPRGMTALHDAIGRTIKAVGERQVQNCPVCNKYGPTIKTIYAILTDGHENASRQYGQVEVNKMISHARDEHGCEFIFLAANQDAFATGSALGINSVDTYNFTADAAGTQVAYRNMSQSVGQYRTSVDNTTHEE